MLIETTAYLALALFALIQWNDFSNARRARSWGAVIPREVDHKYPGSLDLLQQMFVLDKTRYLCEYCAVVLLLRCARTL